MSPDPMVPGDIDCDLCPSTPWSHATCIMTIVAQRRDPGRQPSRSLSPDPAIPSDHHLGRCRLVPRSSLSQLAIPVAFPRGGLSKRPTTQTKSTAYIARICLIHCRMAPTSACRSFASRLRRRRARCGRRRFGLQLGNRDELLDVRYERDLDTTVLRAVLLVGVGRDRAQLTVTRCTSDGGAYA